MTRPTEQELLLALAAPTEQSELDTRIADCKNWGAVLALAERHLLLPMLAFRLAGNSSVPGNIAMQLDGARAEATYRDRMSVLTLSEVLETLDRSKICPILLKGQSLAERIYDAPEERVANDIDLLIPPDQLEETDHLLRQLGYFPVNAAFYREHHYHLPYRRRSGRPGQYLEVHWNVTPPASPVQFPTHDWFRSSRQFTLRAGPVLLPPAEEELRHLAWHALNGGVITIRDASEVMRLRSALATTNSDDSTLQPCESDPFVRATIAIASSLWQQSADQAAFPLVGRHWLSRHLLSANTILRIGNRRWTPLRHVCYWSLLQSHATSVGFLFRDGLDSLEHDPGRNGRLVGFREALRLSLCLLLALAACVTMDNPDSVRESP